MHTLTNTAPVSSKRRKWGLVRQKRGARDVRTQERFWLGLSARLACDHIGCKSLNTNGSSTNDLRGCLRKLTQGQRPVANSSPGCAESRPSPP